MQEHCLPEAQPASAASYFVTNETMGKTQEKDDYVCGSQNKFSCLSIVLNLLRFCISKFLLIGKKFDMFKAATFFTITVRVLR